MNVGDRPINLTQVSQALRLGHARRRGQGADRRGRSASTARSRPASGKQMARVRSAGRASRLWCPPLDPRIEDDRPEARDHITMKRIGILTAGGDTPALNATIVGAVAPGQPVPGRGVRDHQGVQRPAQPRGAPRPPQPAVPRDPRARRRPAAGRSSGRRATTSTPTTPRRSPGSPTGSTGSRSTA